MSLQHFFVNDQVLRQEEESFVLRLSAEDVHHARVLRMKPGEHLAVIDGETNYFECEITAFDGNTMHVCISGHKTAAKKAATVSLACGLSKGDKMDTIIRHATELGVSRFIPLVCERSVVKLTAEKAGNRCVRWQKIAKSAAMQSGQAAIPEVVMPQTFPEFCAWSKNADAVVVCWEEAQGTTSIAHAVKNACEQTRADALLTPHIVLVIGPEGGLAAHEVKTLSSQVQHPFLISLGQSILRTETAGIVAPALVLYELGMLGLRE